MEFHKYYMKVNFFLGILLIIQSLLPLCDLIYQVKYSTVSSRDKLSFYCANIKVLGEFMQHKT